MTDVTTPADEARISRRRALQAGVAAGVGAIAWTGPTITSMGGTPAYAAACTFARQFDLTSVRNVDKASACKPSWGWHPVDVPLTEAGDGFVVTASPATNGATCANAGRFNSSLTYPAALNLDCAVIVHAFNQSEPGATVYHRVHETESQIAGPPARESVAFFLPTYPDATDTGWTGVEPKSNLFYSVVVECVTAGKADCFE